MKKIIFILLLMLVTFPVYAKEDSFYYDQDYVSDMWITKTNGVKTKSAHPYLLKRKSDNAYIYCIQPLEELKNGLTYVEDYDFTKYGLTNEQIDRINLLIYYGYGYKKHTSKTWYGVTQFLIWKTANPKLDIYFTDKKNGSPKDLYTNEITEIENLIKDHNTNPNFLKTYTLSINNNLHIDSNIDLSDYIIETNAKYNIEGNKISFENLEVGHYDVKLIKKDHRFKTKFVTYYHETNQNVIVPGTSPIYNKEYAFDINVLEGKIEVSKVSKNDNKALKGAEYGVYQKENLIATIKTNELGIGELSLPFGEYTLKELVAPNGYKIDPNEYSFIIDENNLDVVLTLYDDKIVIKAPKTGVNDYFKQSAFLIFIGSIGLVYGKKKHYMH